VSLGTNNPDLATNRLAEVLYGELHAIAREWMKGERRGHSMQTTALVNEAYLRLAKEGRGDWASKGQFFVAAAEAMRRVLIDHARAKQTAKRGGDRRRDELDFEGVLDLASRHRPAEIVALDEAVSRLNQRDPRLADVVRLRFYVGLSVEATAEALGVSERTVKRDWTYARAWLFDEIKRARG
jgi:RNA polymerase sigma-70 factor (ECF subfamily)